MTMQINSVQIDLSKVTLVQIESPSTTEVLKVDTNPQPKTRAAELESRVREELAKSDPVKNRDVELQTPRDIVVERSEMDRAAGRQQVAAGPDLSLGLGKIVDERA